MRIVVVGAIVADTIEHRDGRVTESLGGIAHTVSVLSALAGDRHRVVPVCRVGEDCRARVEDWAGRLAGVSLGSVIWSRTRNPRVRLRYTEGAGEGERIERLESPPAPLQPEDVRRAGDADATLVNCITGTDCGPELLAAAREACPRLYLDVHSLAFGTAADGRRYYRPRDDWERWIASPDVLQCNRAEAATICNSPPTRPVAEIVTSVEEHLRRGAACGGGEVDELRVAPSVWLVTLGAAGVAVLQRAGDRVTVERIASPSVEAVDPTGAGDAFGAAFLMFWLEGSRWITAARQAARVAAAAATIPGAPTPEALQRALSELAR